MFFEQLVKVGGHLGHAPRSWHPKMAPYILESRDGVHILDLVQSYAYLNQVKQFISRAKKQNRTFLFVGTKAQAAHSVALAAKSCNSYYINQRWLGGLLTNWSTLKRSIGLLNRMELIQRERVVETLPNKLKSSFSREHARLRKYLGGIESMKSEPDVVIIVGQKEEAIALNECEKLGIRTITLLDTNCNPDSADLFIPVNDDSIKAIRSVLTYLSTEISQA